MKAHGPSSIVDSSEIISTFGQTFNKEGSVKNEVRTQTFQATRLLFLVNVAFNPLSTLGSVDVVDMCRSSSLPLTVASHEFVFDVEAA